MLRWITDVELLLPDTHLDKQLPGDLRGASYIYSSSQTNWIGQRQKAWVVFYGLQVIQIVPEEVHSYWHLAYTPKKKNSIKSGVWIVENSEWLKLFNPQHLTEHKHFILEFYDELVAVVCRDLIFGPGEFSIEEAKSINHLRQDKENAKKSN